MGTVSNLELEHYGTSENTILPVASFNACLVVDFPMILAGLDDKMKYAL